MGQVTRQRPKLAREQQAVKEQGQGLGGPWSEVLLLPHYLSQPHPAGLFFIPPPAEKLKGGKEAGGAEAGGSGQRGPAVHSPGRQRFITGTKGPPEY